MTITQLDYRIVTRESVECSPTDIYRVSEYSALAPEHVAPGDSISHAAARPTFGHESLAAGNQLLVMIRDASWGEYDNSSTYNRSNYRVLVENYGQWLVTIDNGNDRDGRSLALVIGSVVPVALVRIIVGLRDYPVIDESDLSELEWELVDEAWDAYLYADIVRDLYAHVGEDMADEIDDAFLRDRWYAHLNESSNPYEAESATSVVFPDYDAIVAEIAAEVIALATPATPITVHPRQGRFDF